MLENFDPFSTSAIELAQAVNDRTIRVEDLASTYVKRIEDLSHVFNCFVSWNKEQASYDLEKQVDYVKAALHANCHLPLAGVVVAIKDNIMVEGQITSCASRFLQNHRSAYDATVIGKLKAAGALMVGRTNMDEFAMGSSTEHSFYGPVYNPWNRKCVAGGSSGGSAAAVAGALSPLSLGSDTGGSIRQPASFCGVWGLKPTYGRVSRYGLVAYGSSLDQIGPFARTAEDLARIYDVIAGHDPKDSTSSHTPVQSAEGAIKHSSQSLKGLKIGIVREYMGDGLDPDVRLRFQEALQVYQELGASLVDISIPRIEASIPVYYILATAEASSNLARFDGVRYGQRSQRVGANLREMYAASRSEGFGSEVKQRIMLGTYVLSAGYYDAYYAKAARIREMIRRQINSSFAQGVDLIATPTAPTTAFEIGQKTQDSLSMYLSDIYTIAANLAGIPALSHPIGFDSKGLPVGLQLMAPSFQEEILLRSAFQYEQITRWNDKQRPRF